MFGARGPPYDAAGNVTLQTDSQGDSIAYSYNSDGLLATETATSNTGAVARTQFSYNTNELVTQIQDFTVASGGTAVLTIGKTYDLNGNLTTEIETGSSAGLVTYVNTYDLDNRITSEVRNGTTVTYSYNAESQVTSAGSQTNSYDANGNLTNSGFTTGTYNEITSDGTWHYSYDAVGNMTQKVNISTSEYWVYSYDFNNRLTSAVDHASSGTIIQSESFQYDTMGDLVAETVTNSGGTTTTKFAYDNGNIYADLTSSGGVATLYDTGAGSGLYARIQSGTIYWEATDRQGSVREIINAAGTSILDAVTYTDSGGISSQTNASNLGNFGYTGLRYDSVTNYDVALARWYNPAIGQWLEIDPIGQAGGLSNFRSYVGGNFTNATDPSGNGDPKENLLATWIKENTSKQSSIPALPDTPRPTGTADNLSPYLNMMYSKNCLLPSNPESVRQEQQAQIASSLRRAREAEELLKKEKQQQQLQQQVTEQLQNSQNIVHKSLRNNDWLIENQEFLVIVAPFEGPDAGLPRRVVAKSFDNPAKREFNAQVDALYRMLSPQTSQSQLAPYRIDVFSFDFLEKMQAASRDYDQRQQFRAQFDSIAPKDRILLPIQIGGTYPSSTSTASIMAMDKSIKDNQDIEQWNEDRRGFPIWGPLEKFADTSKLHEQGKISDVGFAFQSGFYLAESGVDIYGAITLAGGLKSAGQFAVRKITPGIGADSLSAAAPTIAGTRPGAETYWVDKLTSFHANQGNAVLGQIDNTCGIAVVQIEALRRGKSALAIEKEMAKALVRDGNKIQGLQLQKVYEFLQKAGLNPSRPKARMTVEGLQDALKSGDSAIVMIGKGEGSKYTTHYIVVEGFTETSLTGGYRVPMVKIIDSTEGARLYVTQEEFAKRFAAAVGQAIIIPK